MWRATFGARPVKRLTVAASAIFSSTERGVPGVPNTLNRVPELPKAHEGSSMAWPSSWGAIWLNVVIVTSLLGGRGGRGWGRRGGCEVGQLVLEVEDLGELHEPGVGRGAVEVDEELGHLGLPPGVDLGGGHAGLGGGEVGGLDIAD